MQASQILFTLHHPVGDNKAFQSFLQKLPRFSGISLSIISLLPLLSPLRKCFIVHSTHNACNCRWNTETIFISLGLWSGHLQVPPSADNGTETFGVLRSDGTGFESRVFQTNVRTCVQYSCCFKACTRVFESIFSV